MKYIILVITLLFIGCSENSSQKIKHEIGSLGEIEKIYTFCDKETGIEYLVYDGYNSGGLTIRYDENGNISKCSKKELK